MLDDVIVGLAVAVIVAFLVLAVGLLSRFRNLTGQVTSSNDITRELWSGLEGRLKKQDERIVDMMAKVEVYKSDVVSRVLPPPSEKPAALRIVRNKPEQVFSASPAETRVISSIPAQSLEPTERIVLQLLLEGSKSSMDIKNLVGRSREHTARLMKSLFDRGLVARNNSKKPYAYQITQKGNDYLSGG